MGTILAPQKGEWKNTIRDSWIVFSNVEGLNMKGSGVIDGQGKEWWTTKATPRKVIYTYIVPNLIT